jgi:hypothetical protein
MKILNRINKNNDWVSLKGVLKMSRRVKIKRGKDR